MNIKLIEGQFTPQEALYFITQFMHIKIRFHENKITEHSSEEDIKMREKKIQSLQRQLYDVKKFTEKSQANIFLSSEILISENHGK